jgi:hypothetical protein
VAAVIQAPLLWSADAIELSGGVWRKRVLPVGKIALLALALVAAVALTAVWTGDRNRRKAALDVLDRIIRWRP